MGLFFRIFQHLLPDALAWRIRQRATSWQWGDGHQWGEPDLLWGSVPGGRAIDRLFDGLAKPYASARAFIDDVYLDIFPPSTRELAAWETQFALEPAPTPAERVAALEAAWLATGGQSPRYLQDIAQAAGFDVYVHEWWESTSPAVARDPRDHTQQPLEGTVQCGEPLAQCGEPDALCNNLLANETGYIVNDRLSPIAPPPVPSDPETWPYFLYWGGETFPDRVSIPANRRRELERLLLRHCPAQQWLVMLVDYTP